MKNTGKFERNLIPRGMPSDRQYRIRMTCDRRNRYENPAKKCVSNKKCRRRKKLKRTPETNKLLLWSRQESLEDFSTKSVPDKHIFTTFFFTSDSKDTMTILFHF
uniref:Uncharacterized protein n=1 Tax=Cacopsylla melanoneura TaxID=428564 RepID=A0A8D8YTM2_9HEMI